MEQEEEPCCSRSRSQFPAPASKKFKFDEELRPVNKSSPFSIQKIIETLGKNAGTQELHKLREINSQYYETFSPIYWNKLNKCIEIDGDVGTRTTAFTLWTFNGGSQDNKDCWTSITPKDWNHQITHIFRTLYFSKFGVWARAHKSDYWNAWNGINNLILQLSQHITTVEIKEFPPYFFDDYSGSTLSEFISQFPNLDNLNLNCSFISESDYRYLREGISDVSPNTKIQLEIEDAGDQKFLKKFKSIPNLTMLVKYKFKQFMRISDRDFKNIAKNFQNSASEISKPKLKIHLDCTIRTMARLQEVTTTFIKHQYHIQSLDLELELSDKLGKFPNFPYDESEIVGCLQTLSSRIKKFELTTHYDEPEAGEGNVLNFDTEWSQLWYLKIEGYANPLTKILQNSPKLKKLCLNVNEELCLLMTSDSQNPNSEQENLKEVFKNLKGLDTLFILCRDAIVEKFTILNEFLGFPEGSKIAHSDSYSWGRV